MALALGSHMGRSVAGSFGDGEDNHRHVQDMVREIEHHTCKPGLAEHNVCFVISCLIPMALEGFVDLLSLGDISDQIQREAYQQQDSTWGC